MFMTYDSLFLLASVRLRCSSDAIGYLVDLGKPHWLWYRPIATPPCRKKTRPRDTPPVTFHGNDGNVESKSSPGET